MAQWVWPALLGVAGAVVLMRGGVPMIVGILRFTWPAIVIYLIYQSIRTKLVKQGARRHSPDGQPIIEICPRCGRPKDLVHICRPAKG